MTGVKITKLEKSTISNEWSWFIGDNCKIREGMLIRFWASVNLFLRPRMLPCSVRRKIRRALDRILHTMPGQSFGARVGPGVGRLQS